jgi:hypothetical protein
LKRTTGRKIKIFITFKNNCMKGKYITTQILIACGGKKRNQAITAAA